MGLLRGYHQPSSAAGPANPALADDIERKADDDNDSTKPKR